LTTYYKHLAPYDISTGNMANPVWPRWKEAQCPSITAPLPSKKKGDKSKNYDEGLLVRGLMQSAGWTEEVGTD